MQRENEIDYESIDTPGKFRTPTLCSFTTRIASASMIFYTLLSVLLATSSLLVVHGNSGAFCASVSIDDLLRAFAYTIISVVCTTATSMGLALCCVIGARIEIIHNAVRITRFKLIIRIVLSLTLTVNVILVVTVASSVIWIYNQSNCNKVFMDWSTYIHMLLYLYMICFMCASVPTCLIIHKFK
jgi:hypothetical protein